MTKQLKNFFRGAGSVMDVAPSTSSYGRFIPKQSAGERMRGHWSKTGKHINNAANRFARAQKKT